MSVTLGSPPGGVNSILICLNSICVSYIGISTGGFNSFLIHCSISKQYLCQLHWDLHPEGVNRFWIHWTNFLTVFVLLPCLCDLHQKALTEFWLASTKTLNSATRQLPCTTHIIHPGGRRKDMSSCLFVFPVLLSGISAVLERGPL